MEERIVKLSVVVRPVCTFCESEPSDPQYDGEFKLEGQPTHFCKGCARELADVRMDFVRAA